MKTTRHIGTNILTAHLTSEELERRRVRDARNAAWLAKWAHESMLTVEQENDLEAEYRERLHESAGMTAWEVAEAEDEARYGR